MKLAPFILGTVFSINVFSQVVGPAVTAGEIITPVWVAPTPLTNQLLLTRSNETLMNHVLLNKITELLMLAELEGMHRDWFVNDQQADYLNSLVTENNLKDLRTQVGLVAKNILSALNRGYIAPDKIGEKTNIRTKKVNVALMQSELTKYAVGTIDQPEVFVPLCKFKYISCQLLGCLA